MWRSPLETVAYEFVLTSPAVSHISCILFWMVLEMRGRWPYSCCFEGCRFQDLFNIARSILVQFPSSIFSIHLVSVQVVHPYSRTDTSAAGKKLLFILSDRSDFHMIDSLLIVIHAFASCILMSFSVDETLILRYVILSTSFREISFWVEMSPFWLKHVLRFGCIHIETNAIYCLLQTATGIRLGWVYLPEVLYHLHASRP